MVKRANPKKIAEYREALLTNPESFKQKLAQTRETLRSRAEGLFIDLDLILADEGIEEDQKDAAIENLDRLILSVGDRVSMIDDILKEDDEAQQKLMGLNRKQRRAKDKEQGKKRQAEAKAMDDPIIP